ncbi:MAG TPA: hypothetical protein VJ894_00475, partial [Cryomorphaceae bacterium]|nr:hypothetical protein [Cryomorphaceae bacterium]
TTQSNQQTTTLTSFAKGFASAGASSMIESQVRFLSGNDIGNNPFFDAKVGLKKAVYFADVFKDTKLKEVTNAQSEMFQKSAYSTLVMVSGDQKTVASHYAECNRDNYINAASASIQEMMSAGISNFTQMTTD